MRFTYLLAVPLCLAAGPAAAQFYIGAHGGLTMTPDSDLEVSGTRVGTGEFDYGPTFGGVVGVRLGPGPIRVEGEVTYRRNDVNDVSRIPGLGSAVAAGVALDAGVTTWAFMGNVWYDLVVRGPVRPYLGGGIGAVRVELDGTAAIPGFVLSGPSEDIVFGGQVGAGVAITVLPRLDVTLDYRFLLTQSPGVVIGGVPVEAEYTNHSVRAGVRFRL